MKSIGVLLFSFVFLVGCFGKTDYIRDTRYVVESVPEELTREEELPPAISAEAYKALNLVQRESYLTHYGMQLVSLIESMNARFTEIANLESTEIDSDEDQ